MMFIYCDLLVKSWFPYYKHALILATSSYSQNIKFFFLNIFNEATFLFSILHGWKHSYPIDINEQALLNKSVGGPLRIPNEKKYQCGNKLVKLNWNFK